MVNWKTNIAVCAAWKKSICIRYNYDQFHARESLFLENQYTTPFSKYTRQSKAILFRLLVLYLLISFHDRNSTKICLEPPILFFVSRVGYQCKAELRILKVLIRYITVKWEYFYIFLLNTWIEDELCVLPKNIYNLTALQETKGGSLLFCELIFVPSSDYRAVCIHICIPTQQVDA